MGSRGLFSSLGLILFLLNVASSSKASDAPLGPDQWIEQAIQKQIPENQWLAKARADKLDSRSRLVIASAVKSIDIDDYLAIIADAGTELTAQKELFKQSVNRARDLDEVAQEGEDRHSKDSNKIQFQAQSAVASARGIRIAFQNYLRSGIPLLDAMDQIGRQKVGLKRTRYELQRFAVRLTHETLPLVNFFKENLTFIETFYNWASWNDRWDSANNQKDFAAKDGKDLLKLMQWHHKLTQVQRVVQKLASDGENTDDPWLAQESKLHANTQLALESADEFTLNQILDRINDTKMEEVIDSSGNKITQEEFVVKDRQIDPLIEDCLTENAVRAALGRLEQAVRDLGEKQARSAGLKHRAVSILAWALALAETARKAGPQWDSTAITQAGIVLGLAVDKLLVSGQTILHEDLIKDGKVIQANDVDYILRLMKTPNNIPTQQDKLEFIVERIIKTLDKKGQANELGLKLANTYRQRLVSDLQFSFVFSLTMKLLPKLDGSLVDYFYLFHQRTLVQQRRKESNWEGQYVGWKNGHRIIATLFFTGSQATGGQTLALGIGRQDAEIYEFYDNVIFHPDGRDQPFEGSDAQGNEIKFGLETFVDPKTKMKMNRFTNATINHIENRVFGSRLTLEQYWVMPCFDLVDSLDTKQFVKDAWYQGSGIKLHVEQNEVGFVTSTVLYTRLRPLWEDVAWPAASLFFDQFKGLLFSTTRPHPASAVAWQVRGILSDDGQHFSGYLIHSGKGAKPIYLARYK